MPVQISCPRTRKIVIVGDPGCGKTAVIMRFMKGFFSEPWISTLFEAYSFNVEFGGRAIEYGICNTAGLEYYD